MPMTVFVLVHGAWGGAHGFRKVRGPLRAAGHEVFTPSLTGIGERAHLTSPQVCLTTHIADVVNAVWYEDLSDIVLLGFSYGGFVVTGALEHIAERVRHLVYLDAFVPGDGDTLARLAGIGTSYGVIGLGRDWLVPPLPREFDDPAEAAWADVRRTPHPAGCFTEPVRLARPLEDYPFTRTYIKATGEPRPRSGGPGSGAPGSGSPGSGAPGSGSPGSGAPGSGSPGSGDPGSGSPGSGGPFWAAADRAAASSAWRYHEIATNHMIPSNRPEELARLLLDLA
jgi:pimeloyl-ACP methyl ester carboxylesterase